MKAYLRLKLAAESVEEIWHKGARANSAELVRVVGENHRQEGLAPLVERYASGMQLGRKAVAQEVD